jgi:hypothetical protein
LPGKLLRRAASGPCNVLLQELFSTGTHLLNYSIVAHPDILEGCPKELVDTLSKSERLKVFSIENNREIQEEPLGASEKISKANYPPVLR